ncbi:unnamed protein product [Ranitomeya imitator]|uniref:Phosphatidate cytidylyltransferase n=1 Tax=Ranitomeya imitator TaxID=111125 RepID=A0ABN9LTV9_9NEOB|nr:unnamed protein product [Ranitomeya imitator]
MHYREREQREEREDCQGRRKLAWWHQELGDSSGGLKLQGDDLPPIPAWYGRFGGKLNSGLKFGVSLRKTVWMFPFQIHSIALSTFASLIGPFGGFFASGFKRAFKIKDFANTIPGHGGIMDRFDCQYLMATFVNVYIASFIRGPNPSKLIQQFLTLRPDQQIHIFNTLKSHLTERGMLGNGEGV